MSAWPTVAGARAKAWLTFAPFLVLALLFAGTDWFAMRHVSQLRAAAAGAEDTMLTDIELVWRMQRDLERIKLLADRHVFERESGPMALLENEMARVRLDYDDAVAQYGSKPFLPGEHAPWKVLEAAVGDLHSRLDAALSLSRLNEDVAARRSLQDLESDWARADDTLRSLARIKGQAARESTARVQALQQSWTSTLQSLALAGFALSLGLGAAVTRGLQRRNRRLEDDNRELDAFAARVAHDLKGPLSPATLAVSQLSLQPASPELTRSLSILKRAFDRMSAIIEDLLTLSRARALGPHAVCDAVAATEPLRDELTSRASTANVSVIIDVQPATLRCTEGLFRQVVWNLADNAMKYGRTDVGLRVEIRGRAADHRYDLSVRDNGIGLSPEEATKVFEPFYRGAGGRCEPGTGLGLSIVKRAVEASGGRVWVTSELGRGSTFVARLPLA
jgi:signal transduction histidine kinase